LKIEPLLEEDDGLNIGGSNQEFTEPEESEDYNGEKELDSPEPVKPVQSAEENAKYAAARREAEAEVAILKAEALADANALGYATIEEYKQSIIDYKREQEEAARLERVEQFGYDPEEAINKAVSAIEKLNRELGLGLKTVQDLDSIDNVDKVTKLVQAGFDVVEAYKMANYETLTQANAVRNAKRQSESGRADFGITVGTPNSTTVSVPTSVMETLTRSGWSEDKTTELYKLLQKNTR
jgi:hypothetical protein